MSPSRRSFAGECLLAEKCNFWRILERVALAGSPRQDLGFRTWLCHFIFVLGRLGLHWPPLRIIEPRFYLRLREVLEENNVLFVIYIRIPLQIWHKKWIKLCERYRPSIERLMASKADRVLEVSVPKIGNLWQAVPFLGKISLSPGKARMHSV